jgi:hypothetical protein
MTRSMGLQQLVAAMVSVMIWGGLVFSRVPPITILSGFIEATGASNGWPAHIRP